MSKRMLFSLTENKKESPVNKETENIAPVFGLRVISVQDHIDLAAQCGCGFLLSLLLRPSFM